MERVNTRLIKKLLNKKSQVSYVAFFVSVLTFLSAIFAYFFTDQINTILNDSVAYSDNFYIATKVIDGDTIEVENNGQRLKIRYIGIDTPESVKPDTPIECYGKEASEFNRNLVLGKKLRLESDVTDTDKYGRKLRYVYLEDGRMVNEIILEEGYARLLTIPPNVKYVDKLREAEKKARENKRGLWSACTND